MKTPEEIVTGLRSCAKFYSHCAPECTYKRTDDCTKSLKKDAAACIEQLEKTVKDAEAAMREKDMIIGLMKEEARGMCRLCKHYDTGSTQEPCDTCLEYAARPAWEYKDLPLLDLPNE